MTEKSYCLDTARPVRDKSLNGARIKLHENKLDGFLITNRANVLYLSGFSGSDGVLLLTDKKNYLITDFRYVEQAAKESPNVSIVEHKTTLMNAAASKAGRLKLRRLGIESKSINLDQFNELREKAGGIKIIPAKDFVEELREVKDVDEVKEITNAIKIAEEAFGKVVKLMRAGMARHGGMPWSEKDLADMLDFRMRKYGAQKNSFDTIVAAGSKSSLPHAKPGQEEAIHSGKPVLSEANVILFDWGAQVGFYNSDLTRVVFTDRMLGQAKKVFQIVLDAQRFAIERIKSGVAVREVDRVARSYIEKRGFGKQFGHGLGHGIGLEVHESPAINRRNKKPLKAGMVITIEPGIYLPGWGGIRIEDMVLVTEDGCRVLSHFPKQIVL
ncbi:MAG TPA: M24 family metallopeptidase [Candidatus Brocadiia bacterium]|nr:Xaa-Pro peptidase family protein [Candidatus Brocadiales bacterium]